MRTTSREKRNFCCYSFCVLAIGNCVAQNLRAIVNQRQLEETDHRNSNIIPERPYFSWMYSFPPWHYPFNPEPQNLKFPLEKKRNSKLLARILTPPDTGVKHTNDDNFADTRDSRSINSKGIVNNHNGNDDQNLLELGHHQDSPSERGTSGIPLGLSGRSEFQSSASIPPAQITSNHFDQADHDDFHTATFSGTDNDAIRIQSSNIEAPSNAFSNVIKVPKFDPLPLENHQPLPLVSLKETEHTHSILTSSQEDNRESKIIFPSTIAEEEFILEEQQRQQHHQGISEEDDEEEELDTPVIFPSSVILEESEFDHESPVIFPSPEVFEEEELLGRFTADTPFEFFQPISPRGLNPRDLQTAGSIHPRSIQDVIWHQRTIRRPPRFIQSRNRIRRPGRRFLSWIWSRI